MIINSKDEHDICVFIFLNYGKFTHLVFKSTPKSFLSVKGECKPGYCAQLYLLGTPDWLAALDYLMYTWWQTICYGHLITDFEESWILMVLAGQRILISLFFKLMLARVALSRFGNCWTLWIGVNRWQDRGKGRGG